MLIKSPQKGVKITSINRRGDPIMDQDQLEQKTHTSQTRELSQTQLTPQTPAPSHPHKKHGIMMLACCLIPIVLVVAVSAFGLKSRSLGSLAILLCPLMHIGMMLSMKKSKGKAPCCAHEQNSQPTQPQE